MQRTRSSAYDLGVTERLPTASVPLRALLTLLAVLACGWLLVSWRDERLQTEAIVLLAEQPPQAAEAIPRLQDAQLLSASLQPQAFKASADFILGDHRKAIAELQAVLDQEPENRTGWLLLGNWLLAVSPAASARAFARAAELDGRVPAGAQ